MGGERKRMSIKLELFGETVADLAAELEALSAVIRPFVQTAAEPVTVKLPATPPDEACMRVDEHFEDEGYAAAIVQREPKPAKSGKPKKVGRPPLRTVEECLKNLKQNRAD
jgi:hypothetical protein